MALKSFLSRPFAAYIHSQTQYWSQNAAQMQKKWLRKLIKSAHATAFSKDHRLNGVADHASYKDAVPIRDYEGFRPYIDRVVKGEQDVLWPGLPLYFAKTSGTTSGVKYIPISKDGMPFHIKSARDGLLNYIHETGRSRFVDGTMIFLSGSPELNTKGAVPTGRLSGIVNHYVPSYLRGNQLPSYSTNCIEDWEQKLDAIVKETINARMSLISGIPPWVQMYFDRLTALSGKTVGELFPDFDVLVYGGVNAEPYKVKLFKSIGRPISTIETYPASEGFIAYQDSQEKEGLLLLADHGIFYEFVKASEFYSANPRRYALEEVETGVNYAIILSTNSGLWAYNIGDTVRFVSTNPYRIIVSGRLKHFLSAFGEHVIGEEVENALRETIKHHPASVIEFTVAPQVNPDNGLPYHEWFIAFDERPNDLKAFAESLDTEMRKLNIYYNDLITGNILQRLKISVLQCNGFIEYMKQEGKLGGQNKVPRLSNDRAIADKLRAFTSEVI